MDVLFTAHQPSEFLSFKPIYDRLVAHPSLRIFVSGGVRRRLRGEVAYNAEALYRPLGIHRDRVLSVRSIRHRHFDVLFSTAPEMILPGSTETRIHLFQGPSPPQGSMRRKELRTDIFFMVGPHMRQRFDQAGWLAADDPRGVNVGLPRTDLLRRAGNDRARVCARYGFAHDLPLVLYVPGDEPPSALDAFGLEAIERLCSTGRFNVLARLAEESRPGVRDSARQLSEVRSPHLRVARDLDLMPLFAAADVLLTDAVSICGEFSLADRPIVFLERSGESRLRLVSEADRETWGHTVGPLVTDPRRIAGVVEGSLAEPLRYSVERRAMATKLFYNPGNATETAISFLQCHLQGAESTSPTATFAQPRWGGSGLGSMAGR